MALCTFAVPASLIGCGAAIGLQAGVDGGQPFAAGEGGALPDADDSEQPPACSPVVAADFDRTCTVDSDCMPVPQVLACPVDDTIGPASIRDWRKKATLPVAAMPIFEGEVRTVHRAKVRPCLVVCEGGAAVDKALRPSSSARWTSAPTFLVAPYYGTERTAGRGGWHGPFVERVRCCEYPQYLVDKLPIGGATESVLRLDHIQPIGDHHDYYEALPHQLSADALSVLDEWVQWLLTSQLDESATLFDIRQLLLTKDA